MGESDGIIVADIKSEFMEFACDQQRVFPGSQFLNVVVAVGVNKAEYFLRIAFNGYFPDVLTDAVLKDGDFFVVIEGGKVALVNASLIDDPVMPNRQSGFRVNIKFTINRAR